MFCTKPIVYVIKGLLYCLERTVSEEMLFCHLEDLLFNLLSVV